ncbi:MAG: hypothetical protein PHC99_01645, partial [Methylococcales bacterium]|nr:hypothetical protein [Methylococcales bacterium]
MTTIKGQYSSYYISEDIKGTIENDTIDGLGGTDNIDGGSGTDIALFFDSKNNFSFVTLEGVTQITGLNSADDKYKSGKTLLTNVEIAQFTDGTVTLNPTVTPLIKSKYSFSTDDLKGSSGNDLFLGGVDNIDGNSGNDTVLFFDSKNNFSIVTLAGITQIQGLSSADGDYKKTKTLLTNVETLEFTDDIVNLNPSSKSIIKGQYVYSSEDLQGTSGDDVFLSGNDNIDGGSGNDTALFFYTKNNFLFVTLEGVTQVSTINPIDGNYKNTQALFTNVETLQFTDGVVNLNPTTTPIIKSEYSFKTDDLKGSSTNDVFLGGIDNIDGGSGSDTALFFDSKNNFSIVTLAGITQVKGLNSAVDRYKGNETTLTNIEKIEFTDGIVNLGATPVQNETPVSNNPLTNIPPPITSTVISPVVSNNPPTGSVTISGIAQQNQTLAANTSTLKDVNGLGDFSYQWLQNGKAISGATKATYTLSADDIGTAISVKVSYTDGLKKLESVTSEATALVDMKPEEILPPTYALTVDKTAANEGDTVTFKLATENVAADTEIPFSFSGTISNADVLGGLKTNSFIVDASGKSSLAVKFIADKITEGAENLTLTLNSGESQSVLIQDTSIAPVVTPVDVVENPTPSFPKEITLETKNPYFVGKDSNADNVRGSIIGDDISGNIGNDTLKGGDGDDTIDGGNDNDQIFGEAGDDKLKGGAGNDSIDGGAGDDKLEGEAGHDTLIGGTGSDEMIGGDGNDIYFVDNQNDTITETTNSQGGNDTAFINIGLKWQNNFSLFAGVENFTLTGDKQNEFDAAGDDNANILTGNIGNNRLYGNEGNDTLIGNEGNDTLEGGAGIDLLKGGAGDDTYVLNNEEDVIEDNEGTDT